MTATVNPSPRLTRHWKDNRFNPKADLVFMKPLQLEDRQVKAGDPVTEELKQLLGPHRLKVWWRARVIATKRHVLVKGASPVPAAAPKASAPPVKGATKKN